MVMRTHRCRQGEEQRITLQLMQKFVAAKAKRLVPPPPQLHTSRFATTARRLTKKKPGEEEEWGGWMDQSWSERGSEEA